MGGFDTKGRFHVHWGAAEMYAERREESALRRSGRPVPDKAYAHFDAASTTRAVDRDPRRATTSTRQQMLAILEEIQAASTATCPWPRSSASSQVSGAPYALIYGTATLLRPPPLREARPDRRAVCRCTALPDRRRPGAIAESLGPGARNARSAATTGRRRGAGAAPGPRPRRGLAARHARRRAAAGGDRRHRPRPGARRARRRDAA